MLLIHSSRLLPSDSYTHTTLDHGHEKCGTSRAYERKSDTCIRNYICRNAYVDHYLALFGKEPEVKVMHAGLECGIIQGAYPDMDMVSIGPDLEYPHSPDERVNIQSVQKIWEFITATLERI